MKKLLLTGALVCMATSAMAQDYVGATLSDREQRDYYNVTADSAFTLKSSDCGKTYNLALAAGFDVTLPDSVEGCKIRFIYDTALTGDYYRLKTDGSNTIRGRLVDGSGSATVGVAAADAIRFVSASANLGDSVFLEGNGTSWDAISFSSAAGGLDFTNLD